MLKLQDTKHIGGRVTKFDIAYIVCGVGLVVFELWAVYIHTHQTISHKVIDWIRGNPKKRRVFVAVGLLWLLYHWVFQSFV